MQQPRSHPRGAHADVELNEFGGGDGEEGDARLARHRLGQQRLAGAGRAGEQHARGRARAEARKALRGAKEFDHLCEFLLCFVHPRHVGKGDGSGRQGVGGGAGGGGGAGAGGGVAAPRAALGTHALREAVDGEDDDGGVKGIDLEIRGRRGEAGRAARN